jgi:indolepyruvate ferredoxin oxidoreductase alpha subunit
VVEQGERTEASLRPYERDTAKRVMTPASAKARRYLIEEREKKLLEFSNDCKYNYIEWGSEREIGIIASGISYQHAREAVESMPEMAGRVSFLKLGFTYPLPDELIRSFADEIIKICVIEENEPYIENFVRQLGIPCLGRELLPAVDELNPGIVRRALFGAKRGDAYSVDSSPPPRPPVLCPGCSHRGVFYAMSKYKDIAVSGDIGCYTLGVMPPLGVIDSVICMGAGISSGIGYAKAFARRPAGGAVKKVFGVIGDSTFFHSGITGLIDAVVNKSDMALCILDNRVTAMTGHQENPGTGLTIRDEETVAIDLRELCVACGVHPQNVRSVDSYDLSAVEEALREAYAAREIFVIIATQPCALIKDVMRRRAETRCEIDEGRCVKCKICMKVGCPAISFKGEANKIEIDRSMCNGCAICAQVCPKDAIVRVGELIG